MSDEWGPCIEHDGRGCPVRGMLITAVWLWNGKEVDNDCGVYVWVVPPDAGADPDDSSWWWDIKNGKPQCRYNGNAPIIRYRIRKPRALLDLIEMVENLPSEKERERETA